MYALTSAPSKSSSLRVPTPPFQSAAQHVLFVWTKKILVHWSLLLNDPALTASSSNSKRQRMFCILFMNHDLYQSPNFLVTSGKTRPGLWPWYITFPDLPISFGVPLSTINIRNPYNGLHQVKYPELVVRKYTSNANGSLFPIVTNLSGACNANVCLRYEERLRRATGLHGSCLATFASCPSRSTNGLIRTPHLLLSNIEGHSYIF